MYTRFGLTDPWSLVGDHFDFSPKNYHLVKKNATESVLYVSVPGYSRDDISVELHEGMLTIRGAMPEDRVKSRLVSDKIDYSFELSPQFKVEDASLEAGILAITLARESRAEPIKIPVLQRDR